MLWASVLKHIWSQILISSLLGLYDLRKKLERPCRSKGWMRRDLLFKLMPRILCCNSGIIHDLLPSGKHHLHLRLNIHVSIYKKWVSSLAWCMRGWRPPDCSWSQAFAPETHCHCLNLWPDQRFQTPCRNQTQHLNLDNLKVGPTMRRNHKS